MGLLPKTHSDGTPSTIGNDRRVRSRFPIELPLHFKIVKEGRSFHSGDGRTVDLSSRGIAFASGEIIEPGTEIELAVNWPVLLSGTCAIKLVAFGRVVRSESGITGVEMTRHEFRTLGSRMFQSVATRAPG